MRNTVLLPLALLLIPALVECQQPGNISRPVFPCGGQLTGEQGYVASEGFPTLYPPNKNCSWIITVPQGRVVMLSFRHMDLETDPICRYDHVSVYNGNSTSAERLGRFCGTFRPGAVMSTGNTVLIEMASDDDAAGKGFLAVYTAGLPHEKENQFCGGKLVKPQGSFKTPNWPEKEYPTGISCSWHIVGRSNEYIELKFEKFGVENDNYCRYDYVAVFNGGRTDEAQQAGKFCGDTPPDPIISEGNEILVQFVSDLSVTSDGFLAKYDVKRKRGPDGELLPTVPTTTTTVRPTTRTTTRTTTRKAPRRKGRPVSAVCRTKCRRKGTLPSNFCASNFVISGRVINLVPTGQSLQATISVTNTYKAGNLQMRQVGENLVAKIVVVCKQCPKLKQGTSYTLMGPVDPQGRGRILPDSFFLIYKARQLEVLTKLTNRRC